MVGGERTAGGAAFTRALGECRILSGQNAASREAPGETSGPAYHGSVTSTDPAGPAAAPTNPLAIDLDGVVADTRELWHEWLDGVARTFRSVADLDVTTLSADRAEAAATLDDWAGRGIGDWRAQLERFAEDHAAITLRPDPAVNAVLRELQAAGTLVAAFTDAPEPLARVAAAQLGIARRLVALESGAGAEARALAAAGPGAKAVRTRNDFLTGAR